MKFLADILLTKGSGLILEDAGDQASLRIDSTKVTLTTPTARDYVVSPEGVERFRVKNTSYGIVVSSHVVPVANNTHDLGSTSLRFRASYVVTGDFSGQVTIGSIPHMVSATGNVLVGNSGVVSYRTTGEILSDIGAVSLTGSYSNPSWITSLAWSKITGTPTTRDGYGITDVPKTDGTGASGTWSISVTGNAGTATLAANSTLWASNPYSGSDAAISTYMLAWNGSAWFPASSSRIKTFLGYYTSGDNVSFGTVSATSFSGAGTGLTGTASGLSIGGNAATVTNGVYTTGSYSNPSWITSLTWSKITGTPTTRDGYGITDVPKTDGTGASGTWSISISGTATYSTNASRLYSTDAGYCYGCVAPYYGYLTYDGSYWQFKVSPASPDRVRVYTSDRVQGYDIAVASTANTIPLRDGNGYLRAVYYYDDNTSINTATGVITSIYAGTGDKYLYKYNATAVQSFLGLGSNAYTSTAYLPLAAGSGSPLTGQLWINNASQAMVLLNYTGTGAWYASVSSYNNVFNIYDETAGRSIMSYTRSTNIVSFGTNPITAGATIFANSSGSNVRLYSDGSGGNDGFVGASGSTIYLTNWSGTRGIRVLSDITEVIGGGINVSNQGRFQGWYTSGSGIAVEAGVSSSQGNIIAFDRTNNRYVPLILGGGDGSGGASSTVTFTTGAAIFDKAIQTQGTSSNSTYPGSGYNASFIGPSGYWAIRDDLSHGLNFDVYNSGSPLVGLKLRQDGYAQFVKGVEVYGSASSTLGSGAYYEWFSNSASRGFIIQLGGSYESEWWMYNGSTWTSRMKLAQNGSLQTYDIIQAGYGGAGWTLTWGSGVSYIYAPTGSDAWFSPDGSVGTKGLRLATSGAATFTNSVTIEGNSTGLNVRSGSYNMGHAGGAYSSGDWSAASGAGDFVIARNGTSGYSGTHLILSNQNNGYIKFAFGSSSTTPDDTVKAYFTTDGWLYAYHFSETSDRRYKVERNAKPSFKGIEKLSARLYEKNGRMEVGYYAQDVLELGIIDHAVTKDLNGVYALSYTEVHTAKISRLEERVAELENQVVKLGGHI